MRVFAWLVVLLLLLSTESAFAYFMTVVLGSTIEMWSKKPKHKTVCVEGIS